MAIVRPAPHLLTSPRTPTHSRHYVLLHLPASQTLPVLADTADVLSDQLRAHLERLANLLKPHAAELDRRFRTRLRQRRFDARQIKALCDITPGAAARIFSSDRPTADFFELVEYSGRRLAKLNVP